MVIKSLQVLGFMILCCVGFLRDAASVQPTVSTRANAQESQVEQNLCGPFSLSVVCQRLGVKADVRQIAQLAGTTAEGTSLKGLADAAHQFGLHAKGLRMSPRQLLDWKTPLILHIRDDHFLVVENVIGENLRLIEIDREPYLMAMSELVKVWKGYALTVSNPEHSKPKLDAP